jgi:CheY-like chemotaxis protein
MAALEATSPPIQVLLVEDNPGDVRLIREALKKSRFKLNISVARDGEQALAFMRRQGAYADSPRPEFVLLDLNMPKKDGRAVLAEMKNDPSLRKIPVVIFTSSEAENDINMSYSLHANAYVSKPIEIDHFETVLRSVEEFWMRVAKLPRVT